MGPQVHAGADRVGGIALGETNYQPHVSPKAGGGRETNHIVLLFLHVNKAPCLVLAKNTICYHLRRTNVIYVGP